MKGKLNSLPISANQIVDALYAHHKKDVCFDELRLSSGFANQSRVDFWAMNVGPSTGNVAVAYEIKVSRSDFRRDSHKKQRGARLFSDHLYYIAPKGVIKEEEVPDWAGLIEVDWVTNKWVNEGAPYLEMKTLIAAPKRDKDGPTWGLVVSMIRRAAKEKT